MCYFAVVTIFLSANIAISPSIISVAPIKKPTLAEDVDKSITAPVGEKGCAITKNVPTIIKIRAKILLNPIKI